MLRWLTAPIRGLWAISRGSWVDVGGGLRPGSGASALYLFLFLLFCLIGGVLVALGFDLDHVDAWLDGHSNWFELAGAIAFKGLLALALLFSVLIVGAGLHARIGGLARRTARRHTGRQAPGYATEGQTETDGFGWGAIIIAVIIGYFAAVTLFS